MATKQCARFCNSPSRYHEEAVKSICRYLLRTNNKGLVLRAGYVLMFASNPIMWSSFMQPLIALRTTEAEYIVLSAALCEIIAVKILPSEIQSRTFLIHNITPRVICKVFKDNKSCIEISTNHNTQACTNYLSVRLHHFRSHLVNKTIYIEHISTKEQVPDIFTKASYYFYPYFCGPRK